MPALLKRQVETMRAELAVITAFRKQRDQAIDLMHKTEHDLQTAQAEVETWRSRCAELAKRVEQLESQVSQLVVRSTGGAVAGDRLTVRPPAAST